MREQKTSPTGSMAVLWQLKLMVLVFFLGTNVVGARSAMAEEQAFKEFLKFRSGIQNGVLAAKKIDTPKGIDIMESEQINGLDQWLQIRGYDTDNPVLLYLHGGPGSVVMPFSYMFLPDWEKNFTVVHWDQRGTGKTRCANPDYDPTDATFEDFFSDTVKVVNYLRKRLGKDKIIVFGHSWGTVLGMHLAKRHPELLHAYVGTGQVTNAWQGEASSYAFVIREAKKRDDLEGLTALEALAPYPDLGEDYVKKVGIERHYLQKYGGSLRDMDYFQYTQQAFFESPYYSVCDWMGFFNTTFSGDNPHRQLAMNALDQNSSFGNLELLGYDYTVPILFFLGALDEHASTELASKFFEKIQAPDKKLVLFDKSAHAATITQPHEFIDALVKYVRPLAQ